MGARLRSWWQKVRKPLEVAVIVALALGLIVMVTVIRGVNLSKANLGGAHLTGAYLRNADLWRTELTGAHLTDANLQGAYLDEAHLTRANLKDATGITIEELEKKGKSLKDTIMPDGSKHS